jgi:hypothetical protein
MKEQKMKLLRKCCFSIVYLTVSSSVCLSVNLCDDNQLENVMTTYGRLSREFEKKDSQRWVEFEKLIKGTEKCRDGAYGEGLARVSEAALASDWNGFIRYASLSKTDPSTVQAIVEFAVTDMTSEENLVKIKKNAESKCPATLTPYCESIKAFQPSPATN